MVSKKILCLAEHFVASYYGYAHLDGSDEQQIYFFLCLKVSTLVHGVFKIRPFE